MHSEWAAGPGLALPPWLHPALYVVALAMHLAFPVRFLPFGWLQLAVGLPLIAGAVVVIAGGYAAMRGGGASPDPHAAPGALVVDGPFRISRNPIYLGWTLLMVGVAALLDALWPLLSIPVLVALAALQIRREEAYLERRFGEQYLEYKARVRRWL